MNINFRQLRVFLAVVEHGGVTRAAEQLHLSVPAVSMQLKEIESQVGLPLFDRSGRTIALSTAGEYFAVHAKRLLNGLRDAETAMSRFRKLEHGRLTIGLVGTASHFVPRLLADFHREHPGVEVRLEVTANREALLARMDGGAIDLCVMGRPPRELGARAEPFAANPLVFVAPPGHPLLQVGDPPASALAAYSFIVREEGSGTRSALRQWFAERHVEPRIGMELPSNETIKQAVIAGLGLGFLSLHTLGLELQHGLLRRIEVQGTPLMRTWNLVHLQRKLLSPAAEAFRYFVLEHGEQLLAAHDAPLLAKPDGSTPTGAPPR